MKYINLTPHDLNIFDKDGKKEVITLPPSGKIARFNDNEKYYGEIDVNGKKIPGYISGKSGVLDVPSPKKDAVFVVSTPIRVFLKDRKDVASPGELIRNEKGQPIGCKGLIFNTEI